PQLMLRRNDMPFLYPSPSGDYLLISWVYSGRLEVIDLNSPAAPRVIEGSRADRNFAWSPAGPEVAFTAGSGSLESPERNVRIHSARSGETHRLEGLGPNTTFEGWTPDGSAMHILAVGAGPGQWLVPKASGQAWALDKTANRIGEASP